MQATSPQTHLCCGNNRLTRPVDRTKIGAGQTHVFDVTFGPLFSKRLMVRIIVASLKSSVRSRTQLVTDL